MSALKSVVHKATAKHTATIVFAHGLGDSGHGWSFLADQLGSQFPFAKFIFPHAPSIPITLNGGMRMPGWFDILSLRAPLPGNPRDEEDEKGLLSSVGKIQALIDEEVKNGIDENRIVVGGFSQGAAISLLVGLTTKTKIAGVVCLSGWLPMDNKVESIWNKDNKETKILMGHGTADPVVQYGWGEMSYKFLKDKLSMPNVDFKSYRGLPHSANEQELRDVAAFLQTVLPSDNPKM